MDIETLSASELVAFAGSKGLSREIVGMTVEQVRDFLTKEPVDPVEEETVVEENKPLSWPDLKRLAKAKGINTYKKKRAEIEALLEGKEPALPPEIEKMKEVFKEHEFIKPETVSTLSDNDVLLQLHISLRERIEEIEQRIDRIVDAISKSKRVKGL